MNEADIEKLAVQSLDESVEGLDAATLADLRARGVIA